jgi:hypothetical protein
MEISTHNTNVFRCHSRLWQSLLGCPRYKPRRLKKGRVSNAPCTDRHLLTAIALLYIPNHVQLDISSGEDVNSLSLPPNLPQQNLSSRHIHHHGLRPWTNDCFCISYRLSMHASGFVLGYYDTGEMHSLSGLRLLCSRDQHSRGSDHNVPACYGTESTEAGLEEEVCVGIYVRARIFVSPYLARSDNRFADINFQCMHHEYDPTQIHHLIWDIHRLDM